jgi:methyltransferase (TIGR00027 family)
MENESRTAVGAAMLRAAHQLIDGEPVILKDPVILKLLEPEHIEYVLDHRSEYGYERLLGLRSHIVLRSRYAEDCLKEAYDRGIRQTILLCAGLDTYAYRQPDWAHDLRIIEADHPASQAYKLRRLEEAGIDPPGNLVFVAMDLDKDDLSSVFDPRVLDPGEPVFISWLGVMVYLSWETIDTIFKFVASLPKMSEFVFTFSPRKSPGWSDPIARMVKAAGEPWISHIDPSELTEKLKRHGFTDVHFLEPEEARKLYFMDDRIKLPVPKKSSIVRAIV